jgi:CRP/FNR family transcriptional regulator, cyclic AMP receptor protein
MSRAYSSVPPSPEPTEAVEASPFAERLAPVALARITGIAEAAAFAPGETILREGSPTPFLGVVLVGRVALRMHVPERGAQTLFTVEPSELLGWSAVVAPYRSTADAVALEDTDLITFQASALRSLLEADRGLAADVLQLVVEGLSDRLTLSWHQRLDLFRGQGPEPW